MVSLWLAPIAVSLVLAVPLSALSSLRLPKAWMGTAEVLKEPQINQAARHYRRLLRQNLQGASAPVQAAE